MYSTTEIEKNLITIVAKSLQIPEREVKLQSLLIAELEAESIDILDIRFAIEQQFGFKFDNAEIRSMLTKSDVEKKYTDKDIPALFRVQSLYDYIVYKLEQKKQLL